MATYGIVVNDKRTGYDDLCTDYGGARGRQGLAGADEKAGGRGSSRVVGCVGVEKFEMEKTNRELAFQDQAIEASDMLSSAVPSRGGCDSGVWVAAADRGGAEWGGIAGGIDHRATVVISKWKVLDF